MVRKIMMFVLVAVCSGLVLASCAKNDGRGPKMEQVTVRLDWAPGAEHAFLYLAQRKGYFSEENLNVTVQAGDGSTTSAKLVGAGNVEFALCSGDAALIAATAGVPVRVIAVLFPRPPTVIYSRKDKNILAPKDLEGHSYGAYKKSTTYNQFLAFSHLAGIDLDRVNVVSTAGKATDILENVVDASGGYTYIQPVQCELAGIPVNQIALSDFGFQCYSLSIIANANSLRPDICRRFLRGALRGFADMVRGDPAALEAFIDASPTANRAFEERKLAVLREFLLRDESSMASPGSQTMEGWLRTQEFLLEQQLISSKIDINKFFTTEYLPGPR